MDFFRVITKEARGGIIEVRPDFIVGRSKDLMIRGQSFYAVWDEEKGLWSTDEYEVARLVDEQLYAYAEKMEAEGAHPLVKPLSSNGNGGWNQFKKFCKNLSDNYHQLDMKLTFANSKPKKSDYVSRRLPYSLEAGNYEAWDTLLGTLYSEEERAKIEWSIGAVVSGDSKNIEKFAVFYGPGGTGKSTIMKIIQKLFPGYIAMFEAKALVGNNNAFSTEVFKSNPLVAIQHDGDLSKIDDNSKLNSIVGHDDLRINEKYKSGYEMKIQAFLFMGTNKPVKITDAKSGLIRRLIDVKPTGATFEPDEYYTLMDRIEFELGAIAYHCLEIYRSMGKNYYNSYRPLDMMLQTDVFFNYIAAYYDVFKEQDGCTLKQAYALYKEYCSESDLEYKLPQYKFREELKNYFEDFFDRTVIDGVQMRSYYSGFTAQPFKTPVIPKTIPLTYSLVLEEDESLLDTKLADQPAQYAKANGNPQKYWDFEPRMIDGEMVVPDSSQVVDTMLLQIDTSKLHFVKVPENHIVIDFDLKDDNGEKSLEANLAAASSWPPTYAELSKSGRGVHLHYIYNGGDPTELAAGYSDGIEIKVFTGNSSLRRQLTKCNSLPISTISSGLPFKEKKVLNANTLRSEKGLRELIARNLRKEIHPGTKPSIDFIKAILDEAYESGMIYDVTDMRSAIMAFATRSRHQSQLCLKTVQQMKFKLDDAAIERAMEEETRRAAEAGPARDERIVFYDVEVYPNLFVVCWKYEGTDNVVRMINPEPHEVEQLFNFKLVGFYNRKYDNHILWARFMGYDNEQLYNLSQKLITNNDNGSAFGEAYNLSYADIYDFSSKKQSLKKFEIELGIHHMEMDIPWDQPVPEDKILDVVEYCCNDVIATEATFVDRKQDFLARQILAELSGLTVNDVTRKHAERIIFGKDREPQKKFVYTDLSKEFPGYTFDEFAKVDKSFYRGEAVGEGGYVYAEPGMYENVALLDVASMHPTSIEQLNLFGPYTEKFSEIKAARLAIKNLDFKTARNLINGKLMPFLEDFTENDEKRLKALSDALKLVINSIYGYTSATFANPFRDPRNKDNIVAKRGALFMIDLKHAVQEQGYTVAHIKTDSIKIPNATPEIIEFVMEFGKKYGYDFEHEATYQKFCLVNDAVYIARTGDKWTTIDHTEDPDAKSVFTPGKWTATGAQFAHPYVFKTLFSGEKLTFGDLCETKTVVQGAMYLEFRNDSGHIDKHHVGRAGMFVPVTEEAGGAALSRIKDGKSFAVTGTKGYLWLEAEMVAKLYKKALERMVFEELSEAVEGTGSIADVVDMSYFVKLADDAIQTIEKYGSFKEFVS